MLKGLISGMILRIQRLTSDKLKIPALIQQFYKRLLARGYSKRLLVPIFNISLNKLFTTKMIKTFDKEEHRVFLHLYYHQRGVKSQTIQHLFNTTIIQPKGKDTINKYLLKQLHFAH